MIPFWLARIIDRYAPAVLWAAVWIAVPVFWYVVYQYFRG